MLAEFLLKRNVHATHLLKVINYITYYIADIEEHLPLRSGPYYMRQGDFLPSFIVLSHCFDLVLSAAQLNANKYIIKTVSVLINQQKVSKLNSVNMFVMLFFFFLLSCFYVV